MDDREAIPMCLSASDTETISENKLFFQFKLGFYAVFNIISVTQDSTRLGNAPCPRAPHHNHSAVTRDQTQDMEL